MSPSRSHAPVADEPVMIPLKIDPGVLDLRQKGHEPPAAARQGRFAHERIVVAESLG
jgi:hypothetical protein